MADIQNKLQEYGTKLEELRKKCAEAERDAIVAETNLKNCIQQKDALIGELEAFANCPFDEIPALLQREEAELDSIMQRIMQVSLDNPASQESLKQLHDIINDFGIQEPAI